MMWGYGNWGFIWMILFWAGVAFLVAWAVLRSDKGEPGTRNRAIEILEERFARGELDKDEFEARRRELVR